MNSTSSNPPDAKTILVIEDEAAQRQMLFQVLRTAGYKVLTAGDADEATALWAREGASIDLLLTDVILPGLSGPELAREFRTTRPDLKVIVISGNQNDAVMDTVHIADAKVFLAKPFNHRALLKAVSEALA